MSWQATSSHNVTIVTKRITAVYGIVEDIGVSVGPDALLCDLEPVWLQEQPQLGVVVAGVEVLQACVGVEALADPAFGFGGGVAGLQSLGLFTKRAVDGAFDLGSVGVGDDPHRPPMVEVEPGREGVLSGRVQGLAGLLSTQGRRAGVWEIKSLAVGVKGVLRVGAGEKFSASGDYRQAVRRWKPP